MNKTLYTSSLSERLYLLSFVVFWLAISFFVVARAVTSPNFGGDTTGYLLPIHNFLNGGGYSRLPGLSLETHVPPGFGILALPFYWLVHDVELSGMLVVSISFALSLLLVYWQTKKALSVSHALLAVLFVATIPDYLLASVTNLTDGPFALFLLIAFFSLFHSYSDIKTESRFRVGAASGFALGFGTLIRPEMFFVGLIGYTVWISLLLYEWRKVGPKPGLKPVYTLGLSLALFVLFVLPYALFLKSELGFLTWTGKAGPNIPWILGQGMGYAPPSRPEMSGMDGLFRFLFIDNFSVFFLNVAKNFWTLFNKSILELSPPLKLFLFLTFLIALFHWDSLVQTVRRCQTCWICALALLACVFPIIPSSMLFVYDRLIMPYLVVLSVFLAWGSIELLRLASTLLGRALFHGPLIALAAAMLFTGHFRAYHEVATTPNAHFGLRAAGSWLFDNVPGITPPQVMVAGRGSPVYIRLLGGRPAKNALFVAHIDGKVSLESLSSYMKESGAKYLVLGAVHIDRFPKLQPLWSTPAIASSYGLEVTQVDAMDSYRIFALPASP
ncbi:MAG: glycosyltransferase family 39 protein [Alphaproteobacteria bacterium]|nr:glycosyltransferase family 39 protein [Alphaproteobacteria bacterium]